MTSSSNPSSVERRRPRRISRTRRLFLNAINAQIAGTRLLAYVVLPVLVLASLVWLLATGGAPLIGLSFVALALVLSASIYWFLRVMVLFTGHRSEKR